MMATYGALLRATQAKLGAAGLRAPSLLTAAFHTLSVGTPLAFEARASAAHHHFDVQPSMLLGFQLQQARGFAAPAKKPYNSSSGGYKGRPGGGQNKPSGPRPGGSSNSSGGSSKRESDEPPPPIANNELIRRFKEVRVINEHGVNLGVLPPQQGIEKAREKQLDLILFSPTANPPVCKIASLPAFIREQKELAAEKRRQEKLSQPKEIRCTSRTDDHDLNTKATRILEFLREGRSVRVVVSLTMSNWTQEEPARREVFARIVRKVAEAGVGHCDIHSLRGEGYVLSGMITPCSTPKPQAEVDKVLARLAEPFKLRADNKDLDTPEHVAATIAAAAAGNMPVARIGAAVAPGHSSPVAGTAPAGNKATGPEVILPPPEVLRQFRMRRSKRPDEDEPDDDDVVKEKFGVSGEDLGLTKAPHRKSRKMK